MQKLLPGSAASPDYKSGDKMSIPLSSGNVSSNQENQPYFCLKPADAPLNVFCFRSYWWCVIPKPNLQVHSREKVNINSGSLQHQYWKGVKPADKLRYTVFEFPKYKGFRKTRRRRDSDIVLVATNSAITGRSRNEYTRPPSYPDLQDCLHSNIGQQTSNISPMMAGRQQRQKRQQRAGHRGVYRPQIRLNRPILDQAGIAAASLPGAGVAVRCCCPLLAAQLLLSRQQKKERYRLPAKVN